MEIGCIYCCKYNHKPKETKMKKAVLFLLAAFLLLGSIAVPAYSAVIKNPIVVLGDDPPVPPPPPR
jgi:hypothetical protein